MNKSQERENQEVPRPPNLWFISVTVMPQVLKTDPLFQFFVLNKSAAGSMLKVDVPRPNSAASYFSGLERSL